MQQSNRIFLLFFLSFLSLFTSAQVNLPMGLVAHYPFSGNANDISGNNFHGVTVNGPVLTSDRFGNPNSAYYFDGINDYIKIADNGSFSTPKISIVAWFQTESSALQCIVAKRDYGNTTASGGAQYQMPINYSVYPGIVSNLVGNNNTCTSAATSSYINTNQTLCNTRWYCVVITFDGSNHKIYVDGSLKINQPVSFNGFLSCNSELRLGNWWQLDLQSFKGKIDDVRWYNRALNQDEVTALFDNYVSPSSADFSYTQNICNPKTVQFFNASANATSYTWDFGNSTTNVGTANPTVTYGSYGTYNVKLKIQTSYGCVDSIIKSIPVNVQQDNNLIANNDLAICTGNSITLNIPDTGINHCWSPITGISNVNSATPTITPTANTTYYFTSQTTGANLVANGDFSAGNTGFTSDYISAFPNLVEGQYWVGNNVLSWNSNLTACGDHTAGNGNMLLVNGASVQNAKIWSQTINVTPNSNYAFSTWIQSLHAINPANVKFAINGNIVGNNITAGAVACQWSKFFATWNSGSSATAVISIINNNTLATGNDFALDDISFSPVMMKQDSIKINVTPKPLITGSAISNTICQSDSSQLNASGATNFSWMPTAGLSDPNIVNPKASPATTTTYTVSGYDIVGCSNTKTITVTVNPKPTITKSADANICKDSTVQISAVASNVLSYSWLPVTALSSPSVSNPSATPASTTNYVVTVTGTNGCASKDSVLVTVLAKPSVQVRIDTTVCDKVPVTLTTNISGATSFDWLPVAGLSNPLSASPVANPSVSTQYIITANNGGCIAKDTINLGILPVPALIKSAAAIICRDSTVQLSASASNILSYSWLPITALSNPSVGNPSATPISTTNYVVTATGTNGCTSKDSVLVTVFAKPTVQVRIDTSVCDKVPVILTTNISGATSFDWLPVTGLSNALSISPVATPSVSTQYIITANNGGCIAKDTINLGILPVPAIIKSADAIICKDSAVQLSALASNILSYSWLPVTGLSNPSINSPLATPATNTNYIVTATGTNGCSSKDSVLVTVFAKPTVQVRIDTTVCNKIPVTLTTNSSAATSFSWLPTTGLSNASSANPVATPSVSTQYIVIASNGQCIAKDTINLGILPLPTVIKSVDTTICRTGTANLSVSGGATYAWSPVYALSNSSSGATTALPDTTVKYFVTVTGSNNCSNLDSIKVTVNPKPVFALQPLSAILCKGDSVLLTASGGDLYAWVPNANISSNTSPIAKVYPSVTTQYKVGITHLACKVTDTLSSLIALNGSLATSVTSSNDIDCSHGQSTLHATGGATYEWTPAPGISNLSSPNPIVSPAQTTTYHVKIVDMKGCTGYDSVKVNVDFTSGGSLYLLPSAFTPNGNGKNDCFGLKFWGAVTQLDFGVYSRWGQLIFHTNNPSDCWDGRFNGQMQDPGTYIYQIKAKTVCGDVYRKGTVVLIR